MKAKHPVPNVVDGEVGLDTAECILGCGRSPQGLVKDFPSCWINRYKLCFGGVGRWLALAGHAKPGGSTVWMCPASLTVTKQELIVFCSGMVTPCSLIFLIPPHGTLQLDVQAPIPWVASVWHLLTVRCSLECWSRCALQGCWQVKVTVPKRCSSSRAHRLSSFRECWSVSQAWCLKSRHRAKVCTGWGCKGSILLFVCQRRAERDILMAVNA